MFTWLSWDTSWDENNITSSNGSFEIVANERFNGCSGVDVGKIGANTWGGEATADGTYAYEFQEEERDPLGEAIPSENSNENFLALSSNIGVLSIAIMKQNPATDIDITKPSIRCARDIYNAIQISWTSTITLVCIATTPISCRHRSISCRA